MSSFDVIASMLPNSALLAVTSLGGSGLMLPAAAIVALRLVAASAWRAAYGWMLCFSAAVGLVLATKIAFLGWGLGIRSLDFTGISGHTMLATAVLPVFAYLLLPQSQRGLSVLAIVCGLVLALAVGVSRCVLGVHSPAEVVAGFGLGALVAAASIRLTGRVEQPALQAWAMAALLILVTSFHYGYGNQTNAHDWVVKIALATSGRDHPFSRAEWHLGDNGVPHY
jgi:membrane-associated phospholipid phosphatase